MPRQAYLLLFPCIAILVVRLCLSFRFPVPWPDETGFLAPAFKLATTGSLFDPGLNPDRIVMWMPPGYMVVLAAVFRLVGYSFAVARWVSSLCCLGSLAVVGVLACGVAAGWRRWLMFGAAAAAFLCPQMLADSNFARMEMLFCLVILLSMAAMRARRPYVSASLLAFAGLVHFNAVYFVPAVALAFAWEVWRCRGLPRAGRWDWLAMGAAGLAVGFYGVLIAFNWQGFVTDIKFQFAFKAGVAGMDQDHPAWVILLGLFASLPAFLGPARAWVPALFGLAFLVTVNQGHELWYDYGQPLGFLLILLGLLSAPAGKIRWACVWPAGTAAAVLAASVHINPTLRPLLPGWSALNRPVFAPAELGRVHAFVAGLHPGDRVDFGWSGLEPFFFSDFSASGAQWLMIRHSVTQVWPLRPSGWRVRCDSSVLPRGVFVFDIDYPRVGADSGCAVIRK